MIKYKKYQTAGTIYTDDPKRAQAYQDSLTLHNTTKDLIPTLMSYPIGSKWLKKWDDYLMTNYHNNGNSEKFSKAYDRLSNFNDMPPKESRKFVRDDLGSWVPIATSTYKHPTQPVKYRNPKVLKKQQELINSGYNIKPDGIWGPKSEEAWKQYQNKNITPPIQSTPAPVVNNPQIVNTPAQVVKPKSPKFKFVDDYTGPTYEMSKGDELEFDKQRKKQYGGTTKYQVAGRTPLNKEFMEGISSDLEKHESYLRNKNNKVQKDNSVVQSANYNTTKTGDRNTSRNNSRLEIKPIIDRDTGEIMDYYMDNKFTSDSQTDEILDDPSYYTMHQKYGKPNIRAFGSSKIDKLSGRDYYNPFTNTMAIQKPYSYLHELAHSIQNQKQGVVKLVTKSTFDLIKNFFLPLKTGNKFFRPSVYNTPGTIENEAHSIIYPKLYEEYVENNKQFNIERQNRKSVVPKGKLNYQWETGGNLKYKNYSKNNK
jgi:hypothetical protein